MRRITFMVALLIGLMLSGCASRPDSTLKAYVGVGGTQAL